MARVTDRVTGRALFVLALGVYAFSAGGSLTTTDAVAAFDVTRNMIEHGTVAMSGNLLGMDAHRGADGRYYSPFGIAQSVFNVPFYLAGKTVAGLTGLRIGTPETVPKAAVAMGQTLVGATIVWQIFRLSSLVTSASGPSLFAALTFAFGSVLWPYARFGFNQPLACALLLAAVQSAWLGVRTAAPGRLSAAGWWLAAGLLTRHELGLAIVPIVGWLWWAGRPSPQDRRTRLVAFLPGIAAGIIVWLAFNAIRFGNPFDSGHLRDPIPGFGSSLLDGLLGLLFSPSTSIFLYSPVAAFGLAGLLRPLWRHDRETAVWLLSIVGLFLVFYATLGNWIGGRSYGSRYLLIVLPYLAVGWAALLAALAPRRRQALVAGVIAVGVLVQVPGVLVDYAKVSEAAAAARGAAFSTAERQWAWQAAPIVLNSVAALEAVPANLSYVAGRRPRPDIVPPAGNADRSFSRQFAFSLDLWWLYLFYLGVLPRAGLLLVMVVGVAWVALSIRTLARSHKSTADLRK